MILIALGANIEGCWGSPAETLGIVSLKFKQFGVKPLAFSPIFETAPLGPSQPSFLNAVAVVDAALPPMSLLARLKKIERLAGRKSGVRWGPRALDLDIVDYKDNISNWNLGAKWGEPRLGRRLVTPHPEMHRRPFVLLPLLHIAPRWRHPVFRLSARDMLLRLRSAGPGAVLREAVRIGEA